MTLTIRFWDFDMESDVLGPIRCAHFDAEKKFTEFEDSIRAGTVDSTALARNVFQTVARRRTGDAAIDARCGGGKFNEEEVSTLPSDELDQFCDKLMKGRLRLVPTTVGAESPPAPVLTPGREGLAAALLHIAEKSRAAMKRTLDAADRGFRAISVFDAQHAALGGDAVERAMREIRRSEELVRGAMGAEDILKSALGQTSMSAATEAMMGIGGNRDMIKAALGIDDRAKSFLDQTSVSAAAQTLAGIGRSEDLFKGAAGIGDHMKSLLGPASASAAAQTLAGIGRSEDLFKGTAAIGDHMKSLLGPASASAAAQTLAGIGRSEDLFKGAAGIDDHMKSLLGPASASAAAQTLAGIGRSEDLFKGAAGIDDHMKSLLGPTSMSAAAQAVADLQATQKITREALGIGDDIKSALGGQVSANAALEAMSGIRSLEETARRFTNTTRPIVADRGDMGSPEVLPALLVPLPEITPYRMPPIHNPIHKTNEIVGELLAHQKAEAGKKDAERSEAAIESGDNKKIAKSGLNYTKASFWLAFIAFLFATAWGVWVYLDAKADALETEKKTEIQLEKLRAEIRALKVSKPAAEPPVKTPVNITPAGQNGGKPR